MTDPHTVHIEAHLYDAAYDQLARPAGITTEKAINRLLVEVLMQNKGGKSPMIYLEETKRPMFTSKKKQREIRRRMEPVCQDATGVVLAVIAALVAVAILALIASPMVARWMYSLLPGACAEGVLYVNVEQGSALNGRTEPDGEKCARFEAGDELSVISYRDGWYEVAGSEYGACWVSADYVTDTPTAESRQTTITSNGRVALRDKPDGERLKWLKNGDMVTVYSTVDGWAKVDGGYVRTEYIDD